MNSVMWRTHQRLVRPSTACDNADHASHIALDHLLRTRRELDTCHASIWVVADDGHVVARCPAQRASVANLLLHVGDYGTFWNRAEWEYIADGERSVLAGVDELAGVHALICDEGFGVQLVSVWIAELDFGEWCATAWVMDDVLDHTADVAMAFCVVVGSELGWRFVESFAMLLVLIH